MSTSTPSTEEALRGTPRLSLDAVFVHGFRWLRHLHLDDLGPVNLLVGENGSGKTSVLEAISILCNPLEPIEWLAMVHRRDFGRLDETRTQSLRWCFPQTGQLADPDILFEGACEMSSFGRFPLRRLRATYTEILGQPEPGAVRPPHRPQHGAGAEEEIEIDAPRRGAELVHDVEMAVGIESPSQPNVGRKTRLERVVLRRWEDEPVVSRSTTQRERLNTETLTPYSYQINRLLVRYHSRQALSRNRDLVLELIRQFDPEIESIEVASLGGVRPAVYLRHRTLGPAPLSVFGDAVRRAVLLAGTIPSLKGGVLLIDEIETGIHVSTLKDVFSWLTRAARAFDVQLVATTHSLEAVDALVAVSADRVEEVVAFHLEQTATETKVRRMGGELVDRLRRERGVDVR